MTTCTYIQSTKQIILHIHRHIPQLHTHIQTHRHTDISLTNPSGDKCSEYISRISFLRSSATSLAKKGKDKQETHPLKTLQRWYTVTIETIFSKELLSRQKQCFPHGTYTCALQLVQLKLAI